MRTIKKASVTGGFFVILNIYLYATISLSYRLEIEILPILLRINKFTVMIQST